MKTVQCLMLVLISVVVSACGAEPESTTFVLVNDGEADIFRNQSRWLTLQVDGTPASLTEPGCMMACGAISQPIACALAAEYPTVVRIQPGGESELEWDGTYYELPEGKNCFRERTRTAEFSAEFCYGAEYETFGEEPMDQGDTIGGATVKAPVCEQLTFERGGTVTLRAE